MAVRRKTIEVETLVTKANNFLSLSLDSQKGERMGVASMLEAALLTTNNYFGYNYLASEWNDRELREGYDESRRFYYWKAL